MNLEDLSKIEPVEAPPFLFARIQRKIEQARQDRMQLGAAVAVLASLLLVLAVNVFVVTQDSPPRDDINAYAQALNLMPNHSLYK